MVLPVLLFLMSAAHMTLHSSPRNERAHAAIPHLQSDTIRDTIPVHPYYVFVQYYDSCRIQFYFGELALHRGQGYSGYTGLEEWDGDINTPYWDNSLAGMYAVSGSPPFRLLAGESLSYYKRFQVQPENDASWYIGVTDTLLFYLELHDVDAGVILDTINYWGLAPADTMGVLPWINPDTSVIAQYIMPDFGYAQPPLLRVRLRPVFCGSADRLSLSRWDVAHKTPLSSEMIRAKAYVQQMISEYLDSLSKKGVDGGEIGGGFSIYPTTVSNALTVRMPPMAGSELHLYSLTGMRLKTVTVTGDATEYSIATSSLPRGRYYVALVNDGKIRAARSFEVSR
jgi:hypothetical protein